MKYVFDNTIENEITINNIPNPKHIWYDLDKIKVFTEEDIPVPTEVVVECSNIQLRRYLDSLGNNVRDAVEHYVSTQSREVKDYWAVQPYMHSNHPLIISAAQALGLDPIQVISAASQISV